MRRRRHHHEEHMNHEAWAIPYGDLVTLLLAFFVVMYAMSSVNEGKYRVMADAMSVAFGGQTNTLTPIELGETPHAAAPLDAAGTHPVRSAHAQALFDLPAVQATAGGDDRLDAIGARIERALSGLVSQGMVTVRRSRTHIEVEIQSDLLFASGSARPSDAARSAIEQLAGALRDEPNGIRVEGYTDNVPIRTAAFRSNWELSAARSASVVHALGESGVDESRLAVVGYGEHRPAADNATDAGRNRNRRVQLVILAAPDAAPVRAPEPATLATVSVSDATRLTAAVGLAPSPAGVP
nr:flagellar motor protein MotD [Lysobacter bugurensis]